MSRGLLELTSQKVEVTKMFLQSGHDVIATEGSVRGRRGREGVKTRNEGKREKEGM